MDPISQGQPIYSPQPSGNSFLVPGIFSTIGEENDYLSSLDSDTRAYVKKHTDEFSSKADIIECVRKLHGES